MILSAVTVGSAEAGVIGLVDQVAQPGEFDQHLDGPTRAIVLGSLFTLHYSKRMLRNTGEGPPPVELVHVRTQGVDQLCLLVD